MDYCTNEKENREIEVYADGTVCLPSDRNYSGVRAAGAAILLAGTLLIAEALEPVCLSGGETELSGTKIRISSESEESADLLKYAETFSKKRVVTPLLDAKAEVESWQENAEINQLADIVIVRDAVMNGETAEELFVGNEVVCEAEGTGFQEEESPDVILPEIEAPESDIILPGEDGALAESNGGTGEATEDVILPESEVPGEDIVLPDAGDMENNAPDIPVVGGTSTEDGPVTEDDVTSGDDTTTEDGVITEDDTVTEEIPDTPDALAGFVIDGEGMICSVDTAALPVLDGYLELPSEGCIGIRSGALAETGAGIAEIYIPANITVIEAGAFAELYMLEWIGAALGNSGCVSVDGVLYDGSGTTILAFPGGRTDQYVVSPGVTGIASRAFANTNLTCLDFWNCSQVTIGAEVFGAHNGNGITIKAPMEYLDWYQGQFAGYNVQIL